MASLEDEHSQVYRQLVSVVDQLLVATKKAKLEELPQTIDKEFDEALQKMPDLQLALLHAEILHKDSEETVNSFLEKMLNIRLRIIEQHMITYPILRAIHTDNDSNIARLAKECDRSNKSFMDELNKTDSIHSFLDGSIENVNKSLGGLRELVQKYLHLVEENKNLSFQNKIREEEHIPELERLKERCAHLIKKNLALSSFNISLISSLSKSDVYNDTYLRETLLFCGDYDDYKLEE
ncbi:hypothetical protein KL930_000239 [Ogataea haglerorum]|uniref:Uncharacterized protein n=1 Tax=Ogataea haglerorum TaxID=1937702 RepID=A0ABQ7RED0_9ASCO|nr:uncharacterized protein KL911_000892 [Ogataea haglerorum]KAG7697706.1 hypothetical protein KL951_002280 [Ogataea haglerorum]KAG7701307.1 hypothetical protein KL915_000338 [Ogataea haglerorum]KAG7706526.1 hypothetical protein KL950_003191 [Ogataea haglerorum]KAG7709265.1 hypothetical protein KL914_001655 [Ogataea haglerorum]KAG7717871.1 hypothetical protein KL913_002807 [Ogataea haglerorum]